MATSKADKGFGVVQTGFSEQFNPADMHFPIGGSPMGGSAANFYSALFGKLVFNKVGGGIAYSSGQWTETKTGTSAAIAPGTLGGILHTAGSTSTFNTNSQSIATWTPTLGKKIVGGALLRTSDITTVGFEFNIGSSAVDPATTNYTDVIGLKMAVGAGVILGKVRGQSGTQAVTGTLFTATAATDFYVGFRLQTILRTLPNACTVTTGASSTAQTLSSVSNINVGDILYFATTAKAATVVSIAGLVVTVDQSISTTTAEVVTCYAQDGVFFTGSDIFGTTTTNFTAAQYQQSGRIFSTTPTALFMNLSTKGSAGTPTVSWRAAVLSVDL